MLATLVILTYNEIEGVKFLFHKIPFHLFDEYFVVDGGSGDGTVEFFKQKSVPVLFQDKPGRGEAFRVAMENTKNENVVFFSPDGNEDPNDIPKLLDLLNQGNDLAIASRFLAGSRNEEEKFLLPLRAGVNRIFTFLANLLWNRDKYITDTINGFRAIKRGAFNRMRLDAQGFVIEYQMSIRAMKLGLKTAEIPTYEGNRIGGESKAKSFPVGLIFLKFFLREIFIGKNFTMV